MDSGISSADSARLRAVTTISSSTAPPVVAAGSWAALGCGRNTAKSAAALVPTAVMSRCTRAEPIAVPLVSAVQHFYLNTDAGACSWVQAGVDAEASYTMRSRACGVLDAGSRMRADCLVGANVGSRARILDRRTS